MHSIYIEIQHTYYVLPKLFLSKNRGNYPCNIEVRKAVNSLGSKQKLTHGEKALLLQTDFN